MSAAKEVTFGRRTVSAASPPAVSDRRVHSPYVAVLVAGFAIALAGGVFMVTLPRSTEVSLPSNTVPVASTSTSLLTGMWAANGQSCDVASMKILFDGTTITSVSVLGTQPIGPYTVSGSNPITLSFSNGDQLSWDASNKDKLVPTIFVPDQSKDRYDMMHLTRC